MALRNTTINLGIDGYYAYNFNRPVGRVNLLRAYDVLSNNFSLNQASIIFERAPDLSQGTSFRWPLGPAIRPSDGYPARESSKRTTASDLPKHFPGVGYLYCSSREWLDLGFWKMEQFLGTRKQLHERSNELFPFALFRFSAFLSHRHSRELPGQRSSSADLLVGEWHESSRSNESF